MFSFERTSPPGDSASSRLWVGARPLDVIGPNGGAILQPQFACRNEVESAAWHCDNSLRSEGSTVQVRWGRKHAP